MPSTPEKAGEIHPTDRLETEFLDKLLEPFVAGRDIYVCSLCIAALFEVRQDLLDCYLEALAVVQRLVSEVAMDHSSAGRVTDSLVYFFNK